MAKFRGIIGYGESVETEPGIFSDVITKRTYSGDVIQEYRRLEPGASTNDNLNVSNKVSIVADRYSVDHFHNICFIKLYNVLWKVKTIEVRHPRLILTIGDVYNGPS